MGPPSSRTQPKWQGVCLLKADLTIPLRKDLIRAHKAKGDLVAAVFPIHYPRALFNAFNILTVEVWGPPGMDSSFGGVHLQPYVCSIVQSALSFLQSGGLGDVDLLVVPHTCDSFQGFGSILLDFVHPKQPISTLYVPKGRRQSDIDFLAEELHALYQQLQEFTGLRPSDSDLLEHIQREESADGLLFELHQNRRRIPLSNIDFYRIVRSREYLPARQFIELANDTMASVTTEALTGIPIVLSGIVPEPMNILQAITEAGGTIVADDLACCGRRLYPSGEGDDPFQRMAHSIVNAPPDSTRGDSVQDRLDHLVTLVESSGAKGVIFLIVKFCEPELFYLPNLRKGLQTADIPSVTIETDINDPLSQQVRTRLEAFLEIIQ